MANLLEGAMTVVRFKPRTRVGFVYSPGQRLQDLKEHRVHGAVINRDALN